MMSAALVSLALLQAATPQSSLTTRAAQAEAIGSMLLAYGPVLAGNPSSVASEPIPLRFGPTDAWGCLHAASSGSYCRHMGIATDGTSLLAIGGVPVLRASNGSLYKRCGWAMAANPCWGFYALDPVAYTSFLQAQPLTQEEYYMGYKGEIRGRALAEQKAREGAQRSQPASMPGIHPDAPRPQTPSSGYARPPQNPSGSRPAGGRSGGRELP